MKITRTYRIDKGISHRINEIAKENGVFTSFIVESAINMYLKDYDEVIRKQKSEIGNISSILTV
jgi:dsDNA-specific endonuclease/ATPase MutS2